MRPQQGPARHPGLNTSAIKLSEPLTPPVTHTWDRKTLFIWGGPFPFGNCFEFGKWPSMIWERVRSIDADDSALFYVLARSLSTNRPVTFLGSRDGVTNHLTVSPAMGFHGTCSLKWPCRSTFCCKTVRLLVGAHYVEQYTDGSSAFSLGRCPRADRSPTIRGACCRQHPLQNTRSWWYVRSTLSD